MWDQIEQSLHQSMQRVFTKIAMLLPGILAFIVVLLIFFRACRVVHIYRPADPYMVAVR